MKELIEAIYSLGQKDVFDYLIATTPIILSLIAIITSIHSVKKQNAIALFEKRYKIISHIKSILRFDEAVYDCNDAKLIICLFDAFLGSDLLHMSANDRIIKSSSILSGIKNDILMGKFLFKIEYENEIVLILEDVRKIIGNASSNNIVQDTQKELHSRCLSFANKDFTKMMKEIKIK